MQIVVNPDGSCEFTRTPELLSLLHEKDHKDIQRMTDIRFDSSIQRYYVLFLKGPEAYRRRPLGILLPHYDLFAHEYGGFETDFQLHTDIWPGLITFATYEDAVKAEIRYVEFLRDIGYSMTDPL